MRTTTKRVALPFLFRADDCRGPNGTLIARSYGATVDAVFTRAGTALVGGAPVAHSQPPLGIVGGEYALSLSAAATNLCLQSENFGTTWTAEGSPTRTAAARTVGAISLDLIGDDAGAGVEGYNQPITFTGDGTKVVSLYMSAGTSTVQYIGVFATAIAWRHYISVTWSGGVPTLATVQGSGTLYAPVDLGNGNYRIAFSVANVVAANTNTLYIRCTDETGASLGTVYAGGVQVEDASAPGPYIKTTTTTASRVADACYFPFTLTPREMTVYVRGIEQMTANVAPSADSGIVHIGSATFATDAKIAIYRNSGAAGYRTQHDPGTVTATTAIGATATIGDVVEIRAVLGSTGTMTAGVSINTGTEATNGPSTAQALASAWAAQRLYLNSTGSSNVGAFAYTHVAVALGTKTLAEMRELAEVR